MKLMRNAWIILGLAATALGLPQLTPRTVAQTAADLQPPLLSQAGNAVNNTVRPLSFRPGRSTQGGPSYIAIGANFGALGDGSLGDTSLAVVSKVGLTRTIAVRPGVLTDFDDDATFLVPITYDFDSLRLGVAGIGPRVAPYVGGGAVVNTDGDAGFLLTGGLDITLTRRLSINASANAGFIGDPDVSVITAVGINF